MSVSAQEMAEFIENAPLYKTLVVPVSSSLKKFYVLKEIQADCINCAVSKPFHNLDRNNYLFELREGHKVDYDRVVFTCVTCGKDNKLFWLKSEESSRGIIKLSKIGQDPQKELPRSKTLSKFFKEDKAEYNKAVICIANGYGVAAFAYMRRIVEKNILSLLDQIQESVSQDSEISNSINELKATSPMSDRIRIANSALPDYLKPDGFNPLGQIYGLLSDGVHSLSDSECLDKAENIQACLEFLISELAAHKQNKEEFKKRLDALRK